MTRALRLGLLMHSVLPRGGVVHTLELAAALRSRGHAVTVFAPVEPGQALFRPAACPVTLLPIAKPQGALADQVALRIDALARGLAQTLKPGAFDLLHAQDSLNGNALARLGHAGAALPPWVRTVHHLDTFEDARLREWQRIGWSAAAAIGCVSATWCDHFERVERRPARRLHNGVNLARFHPTVEAQDRAALQSLDVRHGAGPLVLSLGGIEGRKNTVRLLAAFARARRQVPGWRDARLLVAGGASLLDHRRARDEWRRTLEANGLAASRTSAEDDAPDAPVRVLGALPDAAVAALLRAADVVAMPSLVEGFGLVAVEALACGAPVLVSARPPFTEHLRDSDRVAWCDPEDVESVARGLVVAAGFGRVAEVPAICRELAWERSAAEHEAWYGSVLAHVRAASPRRAPTAADVAPAVYQLAR